MRSRHTPCVAALGSVGIGIGIVIAFAIAIAIVSARARADTYVVESSLGRGVMGVDVYGGAPVAGTSVGGGGSELYAGYAWESGWSLCGIFGVAQWSARTSFGDALGDRNASMREGYGGIAVRWVMGSSEIAPYLQATFLAEMLRVSSDVAVTPAVTTAVTPAVTTAVDGGSVGAQAGVRYRTAPWDLFVGIDARRVRFGDDLSMSRLTVVVGAMVDVF